MKNFFAKLWGKTKSVAAKLWTLAKAHKVVAIAIAATVVAGTTCAIVLPIALHEHDFEAAWSSDAENHWHVATCSHEEEKSDLATHTYTNACDTTCDVCGYTRTVGAHVYDNACDSACNVCAATRTPAAHVYDNACDGACNVCAATRTPAAHVYDNACDGACNVCAATRTPAAHVYDNACDTACNVCGVTRTTTHTPATALTAGDTTHYYACTVCGAKTGEVAHTFDKTVAHSDYLKAAATATTKAQYYKSCACGAKSATEYFESDKTAGTLANIQDLSKTYDKVELANPTYETNSDGVVTIEWYQGTTKLDAKPVNAGTYKVKVIIAESATYAGISAEKEFTIARKVLSDLTVDLTYAGTNSFEVPLGAANGILAGDVADGIKVCITFANKNVGAAVTGAGFDAEDGDSYLNYTLDLTTCTASIVPKVLTNISLGNTAYKGSTNFSYALSAYHGLVSGESFTLQVTTASKNVGNAVEIVSISYNNSNYSIDKSAIALDIVPKTINVTAEFEYSGISTRQIHAPSPSLSDVINGDEVYIEIAFSKAGVDATVLTGEDAPYLDGADAGNYELGTYSFSIVPKKLTLKAGEKIEKTETYNTLTQHTISVSSNLFDGYVDTEAAQLWLTATLPSKNVGEYTDGVILTPYVGNPALGTVSQNYDFSEVEATVTVNRLSVSLSSYVKVEYNGTCEFTLDTPFDLTSANTGGGQDSVSDRDEVYITWIETSDAAITDETFAIDYTLGGADACNYEFDELGVEITKKKLTNLHLYITYDTYESGEITLLAKDGVVAGEVVKISITDVNDQDFWEGFSIFMQLADGTAPDAWRYETIALVATGDYANYELATYDDGSGYQVVGIVEGVASCDVQFDGSCNCGSSHLTQTLTVADGEPVGELATVYAPADYSGIYIYKITLAGGQYGNQFSCYWGDSVWYDSEGNEITFTSGKAWLEEGTYYIHIVNIADVDTPLSTDTLKVTKYAKMLDTATMAGAIEPDLDPDGGYVAVRKHNLSTHNGGDTFVLFYSVGEDEDVLGCSINFKYEDGDGGYSATSNIASIEFYDVNGRQLDVDYEEPDMNAASGVTAVGGVYIVVTMDSEGMDNLYFYAC